MIRSAFLTIVAVLGFAGSLRAEIKTEIVEYKEGDTILEGYLAYDSKITAKAPAVVIVHQWKGLTDYEKKRAHMLAELGYVAFAVDIYGKGVRADNPQAAGQLAGKYKGDRPLLRKRVNAGLDWIKKHPKVEANKIAAIGYCFGGTTALELARSGAELNGVISFHGGLGSPTPDDAKNIKCKVLALHGADDPAVPPKEVAEFQDEMRNGKVDWQLVAYGGAVHSFTDWNQTNPDNKTSRYDEKADHRSWEAMKDFFQEMFGGPLKK
jgi:dienelactone hydrolase